VRGVARLGTGWLASSVMHRLCCWGWRDSLAELLSAAVTAGEGSK
jgi:hypothetical protein